MKSALTLRFSLKRLFLLTLVSLVAVAALLGIAASANKANRAAKAHQAKAANSVSADPVGTTRVGMQPAAPLAASITATLTDNVPAATKVAPGGTINYTAVITNAGAASPADDALSLVYNGTLDNNTTIVPGSVSVSTIATNDTYPQTVIGNVSINSANIPYSVVTNDYQGQNGGTPTITAFDATTTAGGQIVMTTSGADIGKFTYNPPPGFEGTDTFTYTFTNSVGSSVGTVSIPVSGMVWFINNNAAACTTLAAGCGRLSNPFSSLAAFQALNNGAGNNPAVNDNIFVYESVTTYTGGVTLLGGQRFIGQDATASLSTITGLTPPSGSAAFPATSPGGTAVTITNAGGNGILLNSTGSSNTVRGMTVTNTSGAKISGTNFGTFTAGNTTPDLVLNGTGQALNLTNGTFAATSAFGDVISTSSTGTGITLSQVAGTVVLGQTQISGSTTQGIFINQSTLTINFNNTTVGGGTDGISLQNNSSGTRTFGALTRTGGSAVGFLHSVGGGITNVTGATSISGTSGRGIDIQDSTTAVTFANVTIGTTGGTGVFLDDNSGAITFADLDIAPNSGQRAFHATEPHSGAITTTSGTITTTNATAIEVVGTSNASRTPLNIQLTNVNVTGGNVAPNGIFLNNTSATGSPGGFTVLGTGGSCTVATPTCTGGRIQQTLGGDGTTAGTGVRLVNANSVSLSLMRLNDHPNFALYGNNVNGFTLSSAYIHGVNGTNAAVGTDECSVSFDNLVGSASITNSDIDGGKRDNLRVVNTSGTLNRLTVSNTTIRFHDTATGNDAFHFEGFNAGTVMNLTVSGGTFKGARGDMIDALSQTGVAMDVVIRGNSFSNEQTNVVSGNTAIIVQGTGTVTYDVSCNKVQQTNAAGTTGTAQGHGINVAKSTAGGSFSGTIFNNTIGKPGVQSSGAGLAGAGIQLLSNGTGTHTSLVKNNIINNYGESGIRVIGNNGNSTTNATIIGNVTTEPNPTFGFAGLFVDAGAFSSDTNIFNVKVGGSGAEQNDFTAGDPFNSSDISLNRTLAGGNTVQLNLTRPPSASNDPVVVLQDNNTGTPAVSNSGTITLVNTTPSLPAAINEGCTPPAAPEIFVTDDVAPGGVAVSTFTTTEQQQTQPVATTNNVTSRPFVSVSMAAFVALQTDTILAAVPGDNSQLAQQASDSHHAGATRTEAYTTANLINGGFRDKNDARHFNHARSKRSQTAKASAADRQPLGPLSGEAVGPINIGTLPAGKSVTIIYQATVNTLPLARQASHQGNITYTGGPGGGVNTTDPGPPVVNGPTVTLIDTLATWNGGTSTDWNTASNWTIPGGSSYAPGVSNPAVNDVVIPNVGNQPNISATDIGIYSLNIANGRTLTITSPRVLTIGGSPGGDLTLDGIISGGNLNLGTGTHVINNAGGTGSLSSTNVATVLSGSTVTLNHNLQAGALVVNSGATMNYSARTLSLNGSGAAFVIGGAVVVDTNSTLILNSTTGAQTIASVAYNNLTINNAAAVTLTGNAIVQGVLDLVGGDLNTSTFTLTQPNTTLSTGAFDVVGTVSRTGGPFALATPLTFGNPNNRLTITAGATRPTSVTVTMVKAAPATYAAAVQRNYTITQTGGSGFTSTLRLHYLDSELNGNLPETSLNLRRFRTSDGHWTAALPTVVDAANNWVECNAVTDTILSTQWTFASLSPSAANGVVTGRIVDNNGNPVEGAVVRLSGTQNRKIITDANGFYRFENVETNGFYTVTPARVNFSFSPSQRSFSQLGSNTEAGFTGASAGESANPLDTAEYFVRQQYVDLLGREPDEGGFNYWSDRILECGSEALCVNSRHRDVAAAFFIEQEFQRTGSFIYGLYKGSLSRRPGYAEFSADRRHVVEGPTHEATKQAFAESFVSRAEFASKYQGNNSAESFVEALLVTVNQSSGIDLSNQRANLVSRYNAGANLIQSRSFVLRDVIDNAGFRQAEYNRAFVLAEYFGYLQRDPDQGGYDFWLDVVSNRDVNNYRSMVCAFISSAEYQRRFSSIVSRNDSDCGQ